MQSKCHDPVFGEMTYRHRWYREGQIFIFGHDWNITVVAGAFSGNPITDQQRSSFTQFKRNKTQWVSHCEKMLIQLVNADKEEFSKNLKSVKFPDELSNFVHPRTLLVKRDGMIVLLFDYLWDEEHGIAVELYPEFAIGSQDVFL